MLILALRSSGECYDTLIIDSNYIYIELDTGEITRQLDTSQLTADVQPDQKHLSNYYVYLSSDLFYNINFLNAKITGYEVLDNALSSSTILDFHRQLSMQGSAQIMKRGTLRKFRKSSLGGRYGLGLAAASLKFPVSTASESESLVRDSVIEARIDGDDIMLTYYQSFGQGVGELDTVFVPWQRDVLKCNLYGISVSCGLDYQLLNSPWILSLDIGLNAWLASLKGNPSSIGLISNKSGYFEVNPSETKLKRDINYSLSYSMERSLSGITKGFFMGSSIGLRCTYTSPMVWELQEVYLRRCQLGMGVFFSLRL